MRRLCRTVAAVLLGVLVLPAFAADEKKPDDKKDVDKKDVDKKDVDKKGPEMVAAGSITGKILRVDETKRSLHMRVEYPEINKGEADAIARDAAEIQKVLLTERNPNTRANRVAQLQNSILQHQSRLYKTSHKDIDVTTAEEVKVRMKNPPPKFDEKGKIVQYTKDELKELKGDDPKATDYKAEFSDLRANQIVQVVLMRKKGTPVIPKPDPAKGKDIDKQSLMDILAEFAPHATRVIILAEPPPQ
jgi:hypothetical protein